MDSVVSPKSVHTAMFIILLYAIQSTDRDEKLEDITSAVVYQLKLSCSECSITTDIIDRRSFACYPDSPTFVTYRARLEGTSLNDSAPLVSVIEVWVRDGAGIIVAGILLTADSKCSVVISSLSEEECFPTSTDPPTDPPTITDTISNSTTTVTTNVAQSSVDITVVIGGAMAVMIVVAIIIVIVLVILFLKNRQARPSTTEM